MTPEELRQQQDAEALTYELVAEAAVTAVFALAVTEVVQRFLALFVQYAAGLFTLEQVREEGDRLMAALEPEMWPELAKQVREGLALGAEQAVRQAPDRDFPTLQPKTSRELAAVVGTIDTRAKARIQAARVLVRTAPLENMGDATVVTGRLRSAVTGAEADTRWAATRAVSEGVTQAADSVGASLVWVSERNACLICLAYNGQTTEPGRSFPADLTFGDRPAGLDEIPYPPAHPRCRCRIELWFGEQSVVTALKRESQRAVARGFSDYDSEPARLRAADRLIKRGAHLPPTVIARARRDVRRKAFTPRPKTNLAQS